jgi:CTP:molybdopterin cytidylyltransferase MocA
MATASHPDVGALVLAAGAFGDDQTALALGPWGTTTLVEHVAAGAAAVVETVIVVLGCDGDRAAELVDLGGATIVVDPEWAEGVASPLRAGLDEMSRRAGIEHVVVIDTAVPDIPVAVLQDLIDAHAAAPHSIQGRRRGDRSATVARFRYARSGPVVLARDLWERFLGMEGSTPIHQTLSVHPDWVNEIWIDRLPPIEVHTHDDLRSIAPRR